MDQSLQSSTPHQNSDGRSHICEETLKKVLLLLDNQLTESEQQMLLSDVQLCEDCLRKYNIEKEFKHFMHAKFVKKACTEQLRSQIQNIVRTQIN